MPITVHVPPHQIEGTVVSSHDPYVSIGTPVGLRLTDFEGISEPCAAIQGVLHPILVLSHDLLPDLSSEVTFELLRTHED